MHVSSEFCSCGQTLPIKRTGCWYALICCSRETILIVRVCGRILQSRECLCWLHSYIDLCHALTLVKLQIPVDWFEEHCPYLQCRFPPLGWPTPSSSDRILGSLLCKLISTSSSSLVNSFFFFAQLKNLFPISKSVWGYWSFAVPIFGSPMRHHSGFQISDVGLYTFRDKLKRSSQTQIIPSIRWAHCFWRIPSSIVACKAIA